MDRHEPAELGLDLVDDRLGAGGDDGDARAVLVVLDLGDRQALDIVAAARKQADHAAEYARLVVDEDGQHVAFDGFILRKHG